MKNSKYNITIQLDSERNIIFNSFTKKFFVCSNKNLPEYLSLINKPNNFLEDPDYSKILKILCTNGFIIDDTIEEINTIKKDYTSKIEEKEYVLTIMTTYSCNFSCWYCVQNHKKISVEKSTETKIINHIKSYIEKNNIEKLHLSWFGGEPLLNFIAIKNITDVIKPFCESHNVDFSCGITTNGSLLDKTMIKKMKEMNFVSFQITIDGSKNNHNKTRYNGAIKDSFTLLLNNIADIINIIPNSLVTLRINYTRTNLNESLITEIDEVLHAVKDKVYIQFRKVWQEPENKEMESLVSTLKRKFYNLGYIIKHDFENSNTISCYVEKKHYISVFPDGSVDKCNNRDIEESRGYISESGEIVWKSPLNEFINTVFSNNSECCNCKYLPLCAGPCPSRREKNNNSITCIFKDREYYFSQNILEFCKIKSKFAL